MAYCPECGSEVAPIDVFCPYCGISLPPAMSTEETGTAYSDDSKNQSVEEKSVEKAKEIEAEKPASPEVPETSVPSLELKEEGADKFSEADSPVLNKSTFEGKTAMKTESFEFNLAPFKPKDDDSAEPEQAPYEFKDFQPEPVPEAVSYTESDAVENKIDTEIGDLKADSDEKREISNESEIRKESFSGDLYTPQESDKKEERIVEGKSGFNSFKEPSSAEEAKIEESRESFEPNFDEPDFTATIPYVSSELMPNNVQSVPEVNNQTEKDSSQNFSAPNDYNSGAKNDLNAEYKVDVSQTPLPEPVTPTPLYISIQPKKDLPEAVPAVENQVSEPPVEKSPVPNVQEVKEGRSFTSPNIGVSDTDGKKAAKLKPLDEGIILNSRYEVIRKIGGGGMGAVYLASDQNLGGVLRAVKEMVQSYIEDEQQEKAINDFRRESMILSTLDHPSIPTIYDYFYDEKESRFYLVMKYINGGDLSARLRAAPEGRLDEKTVTEWAIQIADVLDYLHNRPTTIIYRDLKPSNVMIDGNSGRIMLIDFGIARSVNKEEKGVTAVGTMGYAPPELFSGNVEPRSDIYSLGSTIFHLLTGADPQSNPLLIFDFNKNPRPRQINSRLSDQIEQIIMRAVEYNSAQRFNSAAEMRDGLAKHLENLQKGTVTHGVAASSGGGAGAAAANAPVFCGFCGQKIVATDMFCPFCGAQQPLASQSQSAAPPGYAAPKLTARLMVIGTNELDAPEFSLEKETNLVGRRDPMSNIFPEVDLSKFDPQTKISRKHARIWRESSSYMLEDLGSSNGTVLMPTAKDSIRLLPRQPHTLTHGDKIRVGDTTLHFFIG